MSANENSGDYRVVSQVHGPQVMDDNTVKTGWEIKVRDGETGMTVPVFVEDQFYTVENVRMAIAAKLATVREVHALGS